MSNATLFLLFGGDSCEHEISLRSAASVSEQLTRAGYPHHAVGITRAGEWSLYTGDPRRIADGGWETDTDSRTPILPCPHGFLFPDTGKTLDDAVVFPCLHGANGEDGRLQGLLDLFKIPYIGCRTETSAVCMNKSLTKDLLLQYHVPMAGKVVGEVYGDGDVRRLTNRAETRFLYPMFVKPARCGSSVGAGIARSRDECLATIADAAKHDPTVMVERFIRGREVELAVLERASGEPLFISVPCEPKHRSAFYDYETKYGKRTRLCIPARLPEHTADVLTRLAERIFRILGCRHLARIDFFVGENGEVLFNEINTLPGMTETSVFPAALAYAGYQICDWLPALARLAKEETA